MNKEERFRVLLYIINKLEKGMNRSGEIAIQKLIFLMKIKNKLPVDYEYILYDYGPWSFDLSNDLKILENAQLVTKIPDPSGMGFKFIPDKNMAFVKETYKYIRDKTSLASKVDDVLEIYKNTSAKRLALLTTFIYVTLNNPGKNKDEIIELVRRIKPLHNDFEYEGTYKESEDLLKEAK